MHQLYNHLADWIQENRMTIVVYSEQDSESYHKIVDEIRKIYSNEDVGIKNLKQVNPVRMGYVT